MVDGHDQGPARRFGHGRCRLRGLTGGDASSDGATHEVQATFRFQGQPMPQAQWPESLRSTSYGLLMQNSI